MKVNPKLIAPCGLDCFNCIVYEKNIPEKVQSAVAKNLNIQQEAVPCKGCRVQDGCKLFTHSCTTLECIKQKGVEYCFECSEFPCHKLQPAADGSNTYPHNMKLYNLCRMKLVGIERWAKEESADIRQKYFQGKFVPGLGPVLE